LTEELDALRKQNAELMAWVSKFGDLKKDLASLSDSKAALEKKVESLQQDAQEAHRQLNSSKKEFEAKSKKLEKENEDLEIEHNDTLAELARYKKSALELATVREENEKLRASVLELRNKPEGGSGDPAVASLLEKELQAAQEVHKDLEGQRDEWRELAKVILFLRILCTPRLTLRSAPITSTPRYRRSTRKPSLAQSAPPKTKRLRS
jgi:DNA repair exonuclease SbcCD ATPase subunit